MTKACYYSRESLPPLVPVSAITRRSIWRTPIGDTAMTHGKPCDDP